VELDVSHALLLGPDDGEVITDRAARTVRILLAHELLDVTRTRYEPGERGPDPHIHRQHADAFYVLEGELTFRIGSTGEAVQAPMGTLVLVPAGVIHSFANESDDTVRFLNIHAPSMGFAESMRIRRDGDEYDPARFDSFDPPADGGRAVSDAVVRGPGEGEALSFGPLADSRLIFKAAVGDGDGTVYVGEMTLASGFSGPVPHRHARHLDSFFVLEGTLTLRLGDEEVQAPAGWYAAVPPGSAHTFSNPGEKTVRALNIMAPAGFEQYLEEAAGAGTTDPAKLAKIAARYDFEPA
jgi:mannose-6-phosphate isomerase-like protein (cupin superfamily)